MSSFWSNTHNKASIHLWLSLLLLLIGSACGTQRETTHSRALNLYTDPPAAMVYSVRYYFQNEYQIQLNVSDNHDYSGAASFRRIQAEQDNPQADVYWSGDAIYCERLRQQGLGVPYREIPEVPEQFRDAQQTWTGFVGRGRVFLVRRSLADQPQSIREYTNPARKGRGVLANPLAGSTRTHFAALAAAWGDAKLAAFYRSLLENGTLITPTMEESAELVIRGERDFALVDTDVAIPMMLKAAGVEIVYPDRSSSDIGVMVIPQAIMILKGCKDLEAAKTLTDYLTSAVGGSRILEKEQFLVPLTRAVGTRSPYIWRTEALHVLAVDYPLAAARLPHMEKILRPAP